MELVLRNDVMLKQSLKQSEPKRHEVPEKLQKLHTGSVSHSYK